MPNLEDYVIGIIRTTINWRNYSMPFYAIHLSSDVPLNTSITVNRVAMASLLRPHLTGVVPGQSFISGTVSAEDVLIPGLSTTAQTATFDNYRFKFEPGIGHNVAGYWSHPQFVFETVISGNAYNLVYSFSGPSSGGPTFEPAIGFFRGDGITNMLAFLAGVYGANYVYNFPDGTRPGIAISSLIPGIDGLVLEIETNPPGGVAGTIAFASTTVDVSELITIPGNDPYGPGGISGPGGGTGDYRIIDDPIDFPDLPTISVAEAGFLSIWVPTIYQLQDLAAFMWCADPTKIAFWKQMISNPIDLILGLQLLPFSIDVESSPARVTLGFIDSGINMNYTDQQFWEIDCGELDISEYWGAFLDYGPYTSIEVYLPFIGVRALNVNDCMPKTIHVKYIVDIVTGTCVALIKCGSSLFYHFTGSCAAQVPVTSGQAQQLFGKALSAATSIAAGAATGGIAGALAATVGASSSVASAGGLAGADRSGSLTGTAGFMDTKTPYLIVTRPRQAVPDKQNDLTGYPAFITETLGDLVGYTEVQVTHLHNMSCTDVETREIMQLLQEGVIF